MISKAERCLITTAAILGLLWIGYNVALIMKRVLDIAEGVG